MPASIGDRSGNGISLVLNSQRRTANEGMSIFKPSRLFTNARKFDCTLDFFKGLKAFLVRFSYLPL